MNISQIAKAVGLSVDAVRFYEKRGLLPAPPRQSNGYRRYTEAHVSLLRFIRTAQSLGFSLAEIGTIGPELTQGRLMREEIELRLTTKLEQVEAHLADLLKLKAELTATLASLRCAPGQAVDAPQLSSTNTTGGTAAVLVRRETAIRTTRADAVASASARGRRVESI